MYDYEFDNEGDDGYDAYCGELTRWRVEEAFEGQTPNLSPEARARLIDCLTEKVEEGEYVELVDDGDGESPGATLALTEAGEALVRRETFRATRRRDPAPNEPPRVRPRTACRPLRSARRLRGRSVTRTRGSPSRPDDPEPEPPDPPIADRAAL